MESIPPYVIAIANILIAIIISLAVYEAYKKRPLDKQVVRLKEKYKQWPIEAIERNFRGAFFVGVVLLGLGIYQYANSRFNFLDSVMFNAGVIGLAASIQLRKIKELKESRDINGIIQRMTLLKYSMFGAVMMIYIGGELFSTQLDSLVMVSVGLAVAIVILFPSFLASRNVVAPRIMGTSAIEGVPTRLAKNYIVGIVLVFALGFAYFAVQEYWDQLFKKQAVEPPVKNINRPVQPPNLDRDGDGLTNEGEINIWQTNPDNIDTDGDGFSDGEEVTNGFNPLGEGNLEE